MTRRPDLTPLATVADLGSWRTHARLVGAASVLDLFGHTLMGEARRVPRPLRSPWLVVVRRAQLVMFGALVAGAIAVTAQLVWTESVWLAAPLTAMVLVPTVAQVLLVRRGRRS